MQPRKQVSKAARPLYMAFGVGCLALGYIGYLVPGMPGTVFFLIALWSFKKSSPALEDWLLNKSVMGPTLRDWERDKSMKASTKVLAISMVWVSILASMVVLWKRPLAPWLVPVLLACAAGVTVYIWTRKTAAESRWTPA